MEVKQMFRRVRGSEVEKYMKLNVGDTVPDPGYQSWSVNNASADIFMNQDTGRKAKVLLIMDVSEDIPGFYVGESSAYPDEYEVIRPRGMEDVVLKIVEKEEEGVIYKTIYLKQRIIKP